MSINNINITFKNNFYKRIFSLVLYIFLLPFIYYITDKFSLVNFSTIKEKTSIYISLLLNYKDHSSISSFIDLWSSQYGLYILHTFVLISIIIFLIKHFKRNIKNDIIYSYIINYLILSILIYISIVSTFILFKSPTYEENIFAQDFNPFYTSFLTLLPTYNINDFFICTLISIIFYWFLDIKGSLSKYLITSFLKRFIAAFFVTIFILVLHFLWKFVDELIGKGLDLEIIIQLINLCSAKFIPEALPIAILIASLMTFGNLGENNELSALKSSGISLSQAMRSLIVLSIIFMHSSFLYSNYVVPNAAKKRGALIYDITKKKPTINIREGRFYTDIEGYSIKAEKKDNNSNTLLDIIIFDHSDKKGVERIIIADKAKMKFINNDQTLELVLSNGRYYTENLIDNNDDDKTDKFPYNQIYFEKSIIQLNIENITLLSRTDEKLFDGDHRVINCNEIEKKINNKINSSIQIKNRIIKNKNKISKLLRLKNQKNISVNSNVTNKNQTQIYDLAIKTSKTILSDISIIKNTINSDVQRYDSHKASINLYSIEWHRKYSMAFACFILFIIGSSFGSIIRKGGFGYPILISVSFYIVYKVLTTLFEKYIKEDQLDPLIGMWFPNLIFLIISILLFDRARKDRDISDLFKI